LEGKWTVVFLLIISLVSLRFRPDYLLVDCFSEKTSSNEAFASATRIF